MIDFQTLIQNEKLLQSLRLEAIAKATESYG